MNTSLSKEQIDNYQADGFLHVPDFLSPSEVAELKAAVLEAVESLGKRKVAGEGKDWDEGDGYYDKVFTQRLNLWRINPTVKRYMLNRDLGRMISELEGIQGFRVWHDQALIKEPYGNPTAWHLDNPYWSFSSHHAITIWIALEDATPYNGCMCFVPGTHRLARFDNAQLGSNFGELFKIYPEMATIDPVPLPMKAGDCSFHNGLTAHGAGCNVTRGRRIAMTCAYMPIGSTFNGQQNILSERYFRSLKVGDVLENDEVNPIVWSADQPATLQNEPALVS
jgi:phytanoyl-CoA hydroxylase